MNLEQTLEAADRLAQPTAPQLPADQAWWPQSLAHGVLGIAMLHTELASVGLRPWQRVHDWLRVAARAPVTTGASTGLFYGAPALAFALAGAAAAHPGAYQGTLPVLDARIAADARRRVEAAHARITAGHLPVLAEFDTIRGLAGIGAYLLRRDPAGDAVRAVLGYLVDLAKPIDVEGQALPGWWTLTGPTGRPDPSEFPGGHGNAGMAHGIGGPLALLALAARRGVVVPGQFEAIEAIEAICGWLDSWRTDSGAEPIWPYLIRRAEHDTGHPRPPSGAGRRPSWCYGTAGLARAQQLAALATSNADRRRIAEHALVQAITDPVQRAATTDASLCHGHAGLAHIAARAAADAAPLVAARLQELAAELLGAAQPAPVEAGPGLLEGVTGVALASLALATGVPPATGWDICLLIA
ncbi:MAG: lanthionine synthetase C family protein [Pseudonocardiaceae bacterium]